MGAAAASLMAASVRFAQNPDTRASAARPASAAANVPSSTARWQPLASAAATTRLPAGAVTQGRTAHSRPSWSEEKPRPAYSSTRYGTMHTAPAL